MLGVVRGAVGMDFISRVRTLQKRMQFLSSRESNDLSACAIQFRQRALPVCLFWYNIVYNVVYV